MLDQIGLWKDFKSMGHFNLTLKIFRQFFPYIILDFDSWKDPAMAHQQTL